MRIILFCGLVLFVVFSSCDKNLEGKEYQFPFIELNQCADTTIEGQTIQFCFDSVYDSRCPLNMECFWAGEATVKLALRIGTGEKKSFKLSTLNVPPAFKNDTAISGYKIKLVSVSPYPGDNSNKPYRVELSVTR